MQSQNYGSLIPGASRYTPPELARGGWDAIKKGPQSAVAAVRFATPAVGNSGIRRGLFLTHRYRMG